ncbi:MAG: hypothetical protein VX617_05015 [Pseudomonadota bacterium]|nr:hypothetical protein [Pseudomonadota bacterium]
MKTRAETSGIRLSEDEASIVKGMLKRGDRQHDVASWFGVNAGRIAEIATGQKFLLVEPTKSLLPPPGPYRTAQQIDKAKKQLVRLRRRFKDGSLNIEQFMIELDSIIEILD